MALNTGQMRHVLRIEKRTTAQSASGQPGRTWTPFATVRAQIEANPGREVFAAAERTGRIPTVFRVRHLTGVVPAMRAILPAYPPAVPLDRVFNIISAVDEDGLRVELVITAEELVEAVP